VRTNRSALHTIRVLIPEDFALRLEPGNEFGSLISALTTEDLVTVLFALHTNPEANDWISSAIRVNIEVLQIIRDIPQAAQKALDEKAMQIIAADGQAGICTEWIRYERARVIALNKDFDSWIQAIVLELQLSSLALARMDIAREVTGFREQEAAGAMTGAARMELEEASLKACRSHRVVMVKLVLEIAARTGNGEFLARHRNELWDVVARQLLPAM